MNSNSILWNKEKTIKKQIGNLPLKNKIDYHKQKNDETSHMDRKIQQKTHFSNFFEKEDEELHSNQPLTYVFLTPFSPRVKHN
jgi:hypothetical protein